MIESFRAVLRDLEKSQAFVFDLKEERIERRTDSLTCYVNYVGPLQARLSSRDIKVDFTLIEKLVFPIEEKTIKSSYYDTHYLLDLGTVDYQAVAEAFKIKAESKEIDPKRLGNILRQKEATIARLWEIRLAHQVDELPPLDAVIRKTNKYLRQYRIV